MKSSEHQQAYKLRMAVHSQKQYQIASFSATASQH
jgi:hypothetical protein